ncbi:putative ATP-dependent 6-phosphofructokinase isozyme 2 [Adhaeribacter aerolatus]|uniref:Putative ATP-dependent 6-phosphofructokinase isozyme 2 n=1 Tax=Adhaeribacter aerolatus TaxID=670289 RepID=A0A512ASQ3_9BACT|nr:1-phosphofructokinase family hexose kinase [Adhaeribacter aerolatus]GEO02743.1 putative ATP-dependent 6-phosphofructokinase isozyme 2 [Adhaeribacter aerolatus]
MKIVTLTINPAVDKSTYVDEILPDHKLRCDAPVFEPGGGGINVSRAIKRMGGESLAYYLAGGSTGNVLCQLLDKEGLTHIPIPSIKWTRENFAVTERNTDRQYRFGMPGSEIPEEEWKYSLIKLEKTAPRPEYIVASGSLPRGVPNDYYARVATIAKNMGAKLILDTSGEALKKAAGIGVYLLKPNISELAKLAGKESLEEHEREGFAQQLVRDGMCEVMVVSMGAQGAMLVTTDQIEYVAPPEIKPKSTVGAGDSMVAGMVFTLAQGWPLCEVIKYGVAAGTATTMTPGSELCNKADIEEIYAWLKQQQIVTTR